MLIADIQYAPALGDSLMLQFTADTTVLVGIDAHETIAVTDGVSRAELPLQSLTTTTIMWRFASTDSATLHISLNRALSSGVTGNVSLTARSTARVISASRPWIAPPDIPSALARSAMRGDRTFPGARSNDVSPTCGTQGVPIFSTGTYCGVNVRFLQAVAADAFLAAGA